MSEKRLILAISYWCPHLTCSLLLLLTFSCGSQTQRTVFMTNYQDWQMHKIFFFFPRQPVDIQMNYWLKDWKMERCMSKCNCYPRLSFPKAWIALEIIYDRSSVRNLLFAKEELQQGICTLQGGDVGVGLGGFGGCGHLLHRLQTS